MTSADDYPELFDHRVIEYRVEGDRHVLLDFGDAIRRRQQLGDTGDRQRLAIYCREWGTIAWGWGGGPFHFDAEYRASNERARQHAEQQAAR